MRHTVVILEDLLLEHMFEKSLCKSKIVDNFVILYNILKYFAKM